MPPDGFDALFDGETFTGWEGNLDLFRVEEGALVGGNLNEAIVQNEYLCTEASYGDFELQLEARPSREDANGGIQFRSSRIANTQGVIGYQADLGILPRDPPQNIWGSLYDEGRRRRFLAEAPAEVIAMAYRSGDWNHFRILNEDRRVQIFVNGTQTVDFVEEDEEVPLAGIICLQIHAGEAAEIRYRHIYLGDHD